MKSEVVYRRGFSLIEILVALAVMGSVLAVISQTLFSTNRLEAAQSAEDELNREADRLMKAISADLAQSGWYTPETTKKTDSNGLLPLTYADDRTTRYWPMVIAQPLGARTEGWNTGYGFAQRSLALTVLGLAPNLLPGTVADNQVLFGVANRPAYLKSFYARSQELIFLKQLSTKWEPTPTYKSDPRIDFRRDVDWNDSSDAVRGKLGVLYPSPFLQVSEGVWSRRPADADGNGKVTPEEGGDANGDGIPDGPYGIALWPGVMTTDDGSFKFYSAWQTVTTPAYVWAAATPPNLELREYQYAVIPSPLGMGRLVRAYKVELKPAYVIGNEPGKLLAKDLSYGMMIDSVLSDNCVRVVFDTCRTDSALSFNMIHARLYLARRSSLDLNFCTTQVVDFVCGMRARNTQDDRRADVMTFNGPAGLIPGFVY